MPGMRSPLSRFFAITLLFWGTTAGTGWSDPTVPANILNPKSASEAWNILRLATKNVSALLEENRLPEIPVQISLCSPALRVLGQFPPSAEAIAPIEEKRARALNSVNIIARAAQDNNPIGAQAALDSFHDLLDDIARYFDSRIVSADIFSCPMHPDFLSDKANTPCPKCGMILLKRRIPYSFIYTKPGEPSVRLTATTSAPIEAGKKVEVRVRMEKADKSPVLHKDLLLTHTAYIHLLIEEPGLGDYHLEHPVATDTLGEYVFSFTPKKSAPYRIWADIVPAATGTQELPFVDLPSNGQAEPVAETEDQFHSSAGGYQFDLFLAGGNQRPVKAGQARSITVTVTAADGKPVTTLEPVMNAFAHLVGFYGDFQTVVHIHPTGGDILNSDLRGGPSLGFLLFPPKAGLLRMYCQVMIEGRMLFAPFTLNVVP